ncbi:MAG: GGDEF domain-containing protein, partial [Myxococcota bacterium]
QKALRSIDFCGRYGGEEFVMVLGETTKEGAILCAERVRTLVEMTKFPEMGDKFKVTVSLGVTEYKFHEDSAKTISRADEALYRAKKAGRNRTEYGSCSDMPPNEDDGIINKQAAGTPDA